MKTKFYERDARLGELVLFVARETAGLPSFGVIKMNKTLFFADFMAYRDHDRPITGQRYVKLERGPAPTQMKSVCQRLVQEGAIRIDVAPTGERRIVALREPVMKSFSGPEIAIIKQAVAECSPHTGNHLSRWSHRCIGWDVAAMGETIDYRSIFYRCVKPTADEKAHAKGLLPRAREVLHLAE